MPVAAPPIEPAKQLLGPEPEHRELVGAFGRRIAANAVAIDDVNLLAIEPRRRFLRHLAVRQTDRAGNVPVGISLPRAGIDHDDVGLARFESEEAARRNSDRPEQGQWWTETSRLFTGEVIFRDSSDVTADVNGDPDTAGFEVYRQGAQVLWVLREPGRLKLWMSAGSEQELTAIRRKLGLPAAD